MILAMAWRNLGRHRRRTLLTAGTMAFSVMVCIGLNSMITGFMASMQEAIVDRQLGHIQVHDAAYPSTNSPYDTVPDASALLATLRAVPGVRQVAPRVRGYALFGGAGEDASTGMFLGVDPAAEAALTRVDQRVTEGTWLPADGSEAAVLGARLARELHLAVGGALLVVTNALDGSIGNRLYPVVGIYSTSNLALDEGAMFSLPVAQELLVLDDAVHELVLLTDDADRIEQVRDAVVAATNDDVLVQTWWEISPETLDMLAMQGLSVGVFTLIIVGIAAFIIINTLLMSVYERTREFGVLAAVGTRPRQIVALVLAESTLLATLSGVLGLGLGLLAHAFIATHGIDMSVAEGESYQMGGVALDPIIYGQLSVDSVAIPLASLFLVAVLGGLWPALRAARLDPVAAIRQD